MILKIIKYPKELCGLYPSIATILDIKTEKFLKYRNTQAQKPI